MKFDAVKTGRDDVALLGFTSGTTGEPKATMHFHRDLLIIADGYAQGSSERHARRHLRRLAAACLHVRPRRPGDFPLRFGATATLLENASPANMIQIIETYKATICFTAPTAYRAMLAAMDKGADLSSLRLAVSAGETLPAPVFEDWTRKTGKPILDGIGSTEILHIFITNRVGDARPGPPAVRWPDMRRRSSTTKMNEVPPARLADWRCAARPAAAISPTSARRTTCSDGWNLTGDAFIRMRRAVSTSPPAPTT